MTPSRPPTRPLSRLALLAPAVAAVAMVSCFEPPVREELTLRFLANGAAVVESRVEIAAEPEGGNRALERRLREARQDLAQGTDAWSRRFAELSPAAEQRLWERRLGELRHVVHRALLAEPEGVERFFADTSLAVSYAWADGTAELRILPGVPRPLRSERERVEEWLGPWTSGIATYLRAGTRLWDYLDEHPERAAACFAHLFSDLRPEGAPPPPDLLPGHEAELVAAVDEGIGGILAPLLVTDGEDASIDELSHRVYDPFPAPIQVVLPGPPLAVEGFDTAANGTLLAAGPGLLVAFTRLAGRWLSPDPAQAFLDGLRRQQVPGFQGFDVEGFAALPRRRAGEAPGDEEVKEAIAAGLEPARVYRVVFRIDPEAEPGPGSFPFLGQDDTKAHAR